MNTNEEHEALLDDASTALFRLGRMFRRQSLQEVLRHGTTRPVELSRILVVQSIEARSDAGEQEVTIGTVAERLGIDPSTASRLVGDAILDGYVERASSTLDGRRARLVLSARGSELARDARRYQRSIFDVVTRDWTPEERHEFARLFVRFADAVNVATEQGSRE